MWFGDHHPVSKFLTMQLCEARGWTLGRVKVGARPAAVPDWQGLEKWVHNRFQLPRPQADFSRGKLTQPSIISTRSIQKAFNPPRGRVVVTSTNRYQSPSPSALRTRPIDPVSSSGDRHRQDGLPGTDSVICSTGPAFDADDKGP